MAGKSRIAGIVVEIGGDTAELDKALAGVNKEINITKQDLKDVERLLKLDPTNTELIRQKQELLGKEIGSTKEKLDALKNAEEQVQKQVEEGKTSQRQYEALKREIIETESKLGALEQTSKDFNNEVKSMDTSEMEALKSDVGSLELTMDEAQKQADVFADEMYILENALTDAESATQDAKKQLEGFADELDNDSLSDAAENVSLFGDVLKAELASSAIKSGLSAAANGIKEIAEESIGLGVEGQKAMSDFAAETGIAQEQMDEFRDIMYDIYADNFGEDMGEISDYMAEITQQMGEMDPSSLKEMTEYAFLLSDTFEYDVQEQTRAAQMMIKQFGVCGKDAYNLIVQGAQKGLDKNGDLLDSINEYSVHFEQLGFDAEEMFNILLNGTEEGTFSVDKLGDAMKEFGIRAKDGSDTSKEAFEALGLDAEEMFRAFSTGGEEAKEATQLVIEKLAAMEPGVEQTTAGVNLFGTMWEDLGVKGIAALGNINGEISLTKDSLEALNEVKYNNLSDAMDGVTRGALARFAQGFDTASSDAVDDLGNITNELNDGELGTAMENLGTAAGNFTTALTGIAEDVLPGIINGVAGFIDYFADAFTDPETEFESFCTLIEEETDALLTSVTQRKEDYETAMGDVSKLEAYKEALIEINSTENASEYQKFRLKNIIRELGGSIPELAEAYDAEAGSISLTNDEIIGLIENQENLIRQNAALEAREALYKAVFEAEMNVARADSAVQEATEAYNALLNKNADAVAASVEEFGNYEYGLASAKVELDDAIEAQEKANAVQAEAQEELNKTNEILDTMGYSQNAAAETTENLVEVQEEFASSSETVEEEVDELSMALNLYAERTGETAEEVAEKFDSMAESYANAYNSAHDSIMGQLSLYDKWSGGSKITAAEILSNLASQAQGVSKYAENLDTIMNNDLPTKLDAGFIQYLKDMGPESANLIASLAYEVDHGNEQLVKDLNENWETYYNVADTMAAKNAEAETQFLAFAESLGIDAATLATTLSEKGIELGDNYTKYIASSLEEGQPDVKAKMDAIQQEATDKITEYAEDGSQSASEYIDNMSSGITGAAFKIGTSLLLIGGELFLFDLIMKGYGTTTGEGFMDNMETALSLGKPFVDAQLDAVADSAAGLYTPMWGSGISAADGLVNGFNVRVNARLWEISARAQAIVNRINATLQIHSPSRVLEQTGEYGGEGLGIGFDKSMNRAIELVGDKTEELIETVNLSMPALSFTEFPVIPIMDYPNDSSAAAVAESQQISNQSSFSSSNTNFGGINIQIYGSLGQDVNELADAVSERLAAELASREVAFG